MVRHKLETVRLRLSLNDNRRHRQAARAGVPDSMSLTIVILVATCEEIPHGRLKKEEKSKPDLWLGRLST